MPSSTCKVPFQTCACLLAGGAYNWPGGIAARTIGVLTNRVPTDPYRGAGRPEATHLIERMVDKLAQTLGMDSAEIRRKNFIQPDQFPYTSPFGLVYDSGNYEGALYTYAKKPDTRPQYRAALEKAIADGRRMNRLAPGLLAELGYIHLEDGDSAEAVRLFEEEMKAFPESRPFLESVTARAKGTTTKAEVAS